MSSFSGKIKEFPQISVDRYDGRNLASTAYFLSHAHKEHMAGLGSPQFLDHLESNSGVYLYCSPITARFLQSSIRHRPLTPFICPLQPEEPVKITIPNVAEEATHYLWVTLIPAGHCPGSVMFLFEGRGGTVLYTGDFRISAGEAARLRPLHNEDKTVKVIDSLHIDTTFCHREIMQFPSREESAEAIKDLVEDWLIRGNNFLIHLVFPAEYGYEYIYRSLHEQFGMRIHVSRWKYHMYDTVPEIQELLTLDATATWIHNCCNSRVSPKDMRTKNGGVEGVEGSTNRQLPCRCVPFGVTTEPTIRVIQPSPYFYSMYQTPNREVKQLNGDGTFCRIVLSLHASCSEVLDLVSYLRPRKVFPNVIPTTSTKEEVLKLLHEALNRSGDHYSIEYGGSQRTSMGSFKRQLLSTETNCNGGSGSMMDAGMLDVYFSSPNKRRRHSDSNMTLVLPTPRGNIKGSLSLEGESRQHDPNCEPKMDGSQASISLSPQPSTSSSPQPSTSSSPRKSPKLSQTDSEGGITELEWKDTFTPSPTKTASFFPTSSLDTSQDSCSLLLSSSSAKRSSSGSGVIDRLDNSNAASTATAACRRTSSSGGKNDLGLKVVVQKKSFSIQKSISDADEEEESISGRGFSKMEGSQDSLESSSVFSDDCERDSIFDPSDYCSRPTSSTGIPGESSIKRSRKMWYKHKYFSTPVHDEVDKGLKLETKPNMGPRSLSLPLPESCRENPIFPDFFASTDGERNLPLITVSSPSDQASESQISDETNITVVMSSGEPSDCDALLLEDLPQDGTSVTADNVSTFLCNESTHHYSPSIRPSVICAPPKLDAILQMEEAQGGNTGDKCVDNKNTIDSSGSCSYINTVDRCVNVNTVDKCSNISRVEEEEKKDNNDGQLMMMLRHHLYETTAIDCKSSVLSNNNLNLLNKGEISIIKLEKVPQTCQLGVNSKDRVPQTFQMGVNSKESVPQTCQMVVNSNEKVPQTCHQLGINSEHFIIKSVKHAHELLDVSESGDCSPVEYSEIIAGTRTEFEKVLPCSSRSSCLKTTRRTRDQVEVISLDHHPL